MRVGKAGVLMAMSACMLMAGTTVLLTLQQRPVAHHSMHEAALASRDSPTVEAVPSVHLDDRAIRMDDSVQTENELASTTLPRRPVLCKHRDEPATSNDASVSQSAKAAFRPKLLFIAGIEGSGHHGLVPLFRDLPGVVLIAATEQLLTNLWDPTVSIAEQRIIRGKILREVQKKVDLCMDSAVGPVEDECSHFILFGRANFFSYPYDSPRNPLRHPDLLELIDILDDPSLGVKLDVKILVLHREPYKTVQSNLRRGFLDNSRCLTEAIRGKRISFRGECDALWYLAREAEMQLIYMNAEVSALSAEYFRTVDFGRLVKSPADFAGPLANFFELRPSMRQDMEAAMLRKFKGSKRHNRLLTEEHDNHLANFFNPARKVRWHLIHSGAFDLRALDGLKGTGERELGYTCLSAATNRTET